MRLFTRKPKTLIALDISTHTVKAMLLEQQQDAIKIAGFSQNDYQHNADDQTALKIVLQQTLAQLPTPSRYVALAIPDHITVTHQLSFKQALTDDEVETAVRLKAADYLACLGTELYLDFERLANATDPQQTDIKMIAVRKRLIDQKLNLLISLKLTPLIVDIQSACFLRALQVSTPLLHQHERTTVIKLNSDKISFFDFAYGQLQQQHAIAMDEQSSDALQLSVIKKHLLEKCNTDSGLNKILLAGSHLPNKDTIAAINQLPNISATTITPANSIHFPCANCPTPAQWPQHLSLFGLALRGLPAWQ